MNFLLEIHDKTGRQVNGHFPEELEASNIAHALQKAAIRIASRDAPTLVYEVHVWEAEQQ